MSNLLKYNGFFGSVSCSIEDGVLHGKVECINDLVTYEANTVTELQLAFQEAVDDYLETCAEIGKEPEKPMSGTFNIRIGSDNHKKAYLAAKSAGLSLNDFIKCAVEEKLSENREVHMHLHVENKAEHPRPLVFTSEQSFKREDGLPIASRGVPFTSAISAWVEEVH